MDQLAFLALEAQLGLIKYWHSERGRVDAHGIVASMMLSSGAAPSSTDFIAGALHALGQAETYFVGNEICNLLQDSLSTLPDNVAMGGVPLPSSIGFAYFQSPLIGERRVRAVAWGRGGDLKPGLERGGRGGRTARAEQTFVSLEDLDMSFIFFEFYADGETAGAPSLQLMSTLEWPLIDSAEDFSPRQGSITYEKDAGFEFMLKMRRFIVSLFCFVDQTISVTEQQTAPRHLRKRIAREFGGTGSPIINTIQLRRREYRRSPSEGMAKGIDWSCRWIVRAHWRNQYYASKFGEPTHRPKLIPSCVKGPDSKPLKSKTINLFAVVR